MMTIDFSYNFNTVIATISLIILVWWFFLYPTFFSPLRHIPAVQTGWRTRVYEWIYKEPTPPQIVEWIKKTPNNGLVRYYGIGGTQRVLLTSPDAVREVMVTKRYEFFQKPDTMNQVIRKLFGEGLLTSEGDAHRLQKRALGPVFVPRVIKHLYPVFWSKACNLVSQLEHDLEQSMEKDVELVDWTSRAALDIIGVAVWGRDFDAIAHPDSEFVHRYERIFRPGSKKSKDQAQWIYTASLVIPMDWLSRWFPCEFFREKTLGAIAVRQASSAALKARRAAIIGGQKAENDILSHILALDSQDFDDIALQGQLMNFLSAGHGTVSLTVTWLCYFLAKHPAVQEKLRREVRTALVAPPSEAISFDAELIASLPLLRAVIRETLRLVPIVPLLRRESTKDTTIVGYPIPTNTSVVCAPWISHLQEQQWGPQAAEFDPDRWLVNDDPPKAFSYLPFSVGPRSCIGEGFAKAEVAVLVAALVRSFSFDLSHPEKALSVIWGVSVTPIGLLFRMKRVEE